VGSTSMVVEAGTEKERTHGVDPAVVGEAVNAALRRTWRSGHTAWTRRRLVRR
jgi:hypothetical protein